VTGEDEGHATGIAGVTARFQARVTPIVDRVLATPLASLGVGVMDRFGAAGGGVTAAGLAYSLIFAIVPTLLILVSLLGIFITDAAERDRLLNLLIAQFPPLEGLASEILKQVSDGAWTFSFIGLVGLFWGASRFYAALDSSVALYFPREPRRDIVRQTIESIISVAFFLGSAIGGVVVLWWVADLSLIPTASGDALLRRLVGAAAVTLWLCTVLLLVYRFVPARHIRWRDALVPALVTGVTVSALTQVFAIVTPLFFKSLRLYGAFVALFAALIWLSLCTQIVLIGVAWLARRVGAPGPERPAAAASAATAGPSGERAS
jgi:membrane protein